MRKLAESRPDYPPILFFYQGTVDEGEVFFRKLWPEARAVSDKPKQFYNSMGIQRGGLKEMFGPETIACGVRATSKGHFVGAPVGDPWVMPGLFLVDATGQVIWRHHFRHAGDHPEFASIAAQVPPIT